MVEQYQSKYSISHLAQIFIFLIIPIIASAQTTPAPPSAGTNPWASTNPTNNNVKRSSYPDTIVFANGAFLNNIGDDRVLAQQVGNLTTISNQLLSTDCNAIHTFVRAFLPFLVVALLVACLVLKTSILSLVHVVEFIQELFLIGLMNIVREPCLYEFKLNLKVFFFVFTQRNNTMINTNILKRIFFQSVYFLENTSEISFIIAGLLLVYMIFATLHLMLYNPKGAVSKRFDELLGFFEFGFFIRML